MERRIGIFDPLSPRNILTQEWVVCNMLIIQHLCYCSPPSIKSWQISTTNRTIPSLHRSRILRRRILRRLVLHNCQSFQGPTPQSLALQGPTLQLCTPQCHRSSPQEKGHRGWSEIISYGPHFLRDKDRYNAFWPMKRYPCHHGSSQPRLLCILMYWTNTRSY